MSAQGPRFRPRGHRIGLIAFPMKISMLIAQFYANTILIISATFPKTCRNTIKTRNYVTSGQYFIISGSVAIISGSVAIIRFQWLTPRSGSRNTSAWEPLLNSVLKFLYFLTVFSSECFICSSYEYLFHVSPFYIYISANRLFMKIVINPWMMKLSQILLLINVH
jgi:hypothetical protein